VNIDLIAQMKSSADFFEAYKEGDEKKTYQGVSLIFYSLANTDAVARYEISAFLIDKGVNLTMRNSNEATALHVLLGHVEHNISETIELCKRLIESGVDVGALDKKNISIMQSIVNIGIHEDNLEPLYDVLFAQENLDFLSKNFRGFSPKDLALKDGTRPKLIERMNAHERRKND